MEINEYLPMITTILQNHLRDSLPRIFIKSKIKLIKNVLLFILWKSNNNNVLLTVT